MAPRMLDKELHYMFQILIHELADEGKLANNVVIHEIFTIF
jgi:hypothetical protein